MSLHQRPKPLTGSEIEINDLDLLLPGTVLQPLQIPVNATLSKYYFVAGVSIISDRGHPTPFHILREKYSQLKFIVKYLPE